MARLIIKSPIMKKQQVLITLSADMEYSSHDTVVTTVTPDTVKKLCNSIDPFLRNYCVTKSKVSNFKRKHLHVNG